ncbi:MAG: class I SAM-dependent methyltransferase [Desmonostoc vinosum HA7617-LM4]|jgi:SAM-dependent methyltransferase|nr:class I SAM-dependent methyltransferase [Desmonostoc vinosum HA7617-LM4]
MQFYTDEGYKYIDEGSSSSAHEVVPLIMKLIQPKRVVDVGCGIGNWLSVFQEHGVEEILGIDGEHVNLEMLRIKPKNFLVHNLIKPLNLNRDFDLVVSLEVAEHLPEESAEQFVQTLTSLGPVILFAAAIPYQTGYQHINCQWPDYWINLFSNHEYLVVDCLRKRFWENENVEWWYAQNLFLFVQKSAFKSYPLIQHEYFNENKFPLRIVHPKLYSLKEQDYQYLQKALERRKEYLNFFSPLIKLLRKK